MRMDLRNPAEPWYHGKGIPLSPKPSIPFLSLPPDSPVVKTAVSAQCAPGDGYRGADDHHFYRRRRKLSCPSLSWSFHLPQCGPTAARAQRMRRQPQTPFEYEQAARGNMVGYPRSLGTYHCSEKGPPVASVGMIDTRVASLAQELVLSLAPQEAGLHNPPHYVLRLDMRGQCTRNLIVSFDIATFQQLTKCNILSMRTSRTCAILTL